MSTAYLPISLPSGCRTYTAISSPNDIVVRPYTGEDESLLAQINPANIERNFLSILSRAVQGINPRDLTTGDRLYLMVWEYINSYSDYLHVMQMCSHCMGTVEFPVDVKTKLKVVPLDPSLQIPTEITLPVSGNIVNLRPLTLGDLVDIEKSVAEGKDPSLLQLAHTFAGRDDYEALAASMANWAIKDTARIRYYIETETWHGLDTNVHIPCPKCGEEEEVIVPFRLDLFYPTGSALGSCFGT